MSSCSPSCPFTSTHSTNAQTALGRHSGAESSEGWIKRFPRERHESTEEEEGEIEKDTIREVGRKGSEGEGGEEGETREDQMDSTQRKGSGAKLTEQQ